jgi:hypothetical protein
MPRRLARPPGPPAPSGSARAHAGRQKPLHLAAEGGFVDTMRILISASASVNDIDSVPAARRPAHPLCPAGPPFFPRTPLPLARSR